MPVSQSFALKNRVLLGTLVVLLAMVLLAGGWSIPFHYESFSILYKFGKLKLYLRYGKVLGITIALLLFFQVLLASRVKILVQIFSAKRVLVLHRINGFIIACLIIAHPVLIKASENFTHIPLAKNTIRNLSGSACFLFCSLFLSLPSSAAFSRWITTGGAFCIGWERQWHC